MLARPAAMAGVTARHLASSPPQVPFSGVWPIVATPFTDEGALALDDLERVVKFYVGAGVQGVTVVGVLGESNRLLDRERDDIVRTAVAAASGGVRVCVGVSHAGTDAAVELGRRAGDLGADAVMLSATQEAVPGDAKVLGLFERAAEQIGLPIVLQDHPMSTGVHMGIDLVARIVREFDPVCCVKLESPPTPARTQQLLARLEGDRAGCSVLCGLGAL